MIFPSLISNHFDGSKHISGIPYTRGTELEIKYILKQSTACVGIMNKRIDVFCLSLDGYKIHLIQPNTWIGLKLKGVFKHLIAFC